MHFHQFLEQERREMLRHKWIESEKAGYDLGDRALFDWIEKYADSFRQKAVLEEVDEQDGACHGGYAVAR